MKYVPNAVSRTVGRQLLKTQKSSPTLLFAAGCVGFVATTVLVARATLKLEDVLDVHEENMKVLVEGPDVEIHKKDLARVYLNTSVDLAKLYSPAIIVGIASITCLTSSHQILSRRNAALTAAYAGLDRSFTAYRDRVREEFGEEKEEQLRVGYEICDMTGEDGKLIKGKIVTKDKVDGTWSPYAVFFDQTNRNWQKNDNQNMVFLRMQQTYANEKLQANGHLFLNEVYDALGMDRIPEGQMVGWVRDHSQGDGYVTFGFDMNVRGRANEILLDFNVDGVVYDLI